MFAIKQNFIKFNRSYQQLIPEGIVLHETANPGDSDEMEQKYFNSGNRKASAHAFIDSDSITQCIPWNEVAWHAGRTANHRFIGIELCHAKTQDKFNIIYQQGVELFAWLFVNVLKLKAVTKDNLMSHAEVSAKWKETDHTDPIAYFKKFGKTVDGFRADVQKEIDRIMKPKIKVDNLPDAVQILTVKGIIQSSQYWLENALGSKMVKGAYVRTVVCRVTNIQDYNQAIDYLAQQKVINTASYWKYKDEFLGEYVQKLLIALANL